MRGATIISPPSCARAVERRRHLRDRLDRHLDRRVRRRRARSRRTAGGDRAACARRDHRLRRALWRNRMGAVLARACASSRRSAATCSTARRRSGGSPTYFQVATTAGFGPLSRPELAAAAACVTYVERTQLGKRPPLSPPARESAGSVLSIDAATRANLELIVTLSGERQGSLLATIDRTVTAAGSRAARAAARRAADRCRRHRAAARCGRGARRRRRPCGGRCASSFAPVRISRARSRASSSAAAGRAISPRSATGLTAAAAIGAASRAWTQSDRGDRAMRAARSRAVRCSDHGGTCRGARRRVAAAQARRRIHSRGLRIARSTRCARCAMNRAA